MHVLFAKSLCNELKKLSSWGLLDSLSWVPSNKSIQLFSDRESVLGISSAIWLCLRKILRLLHAIDRPLLWNFLTAAKGLLLWWSSHCPNICSVLKRLSAYPWEANTNKLHPTFTIYKTIVFLEQWRSILHSRIVRLATCSLSTSGARSFWIPDVCCQPRGASETLGISCWCYLDVLLVLGSNSCKVLSEFGIS
jgi:hypothetical protein